jgi:hypothetical protein
MKLTQLGLIEVDIEQVCASRHRNILSKSGLYRPTIPSILRHSQDVIIWAEHRELLH